MGLASMFLLGMAVNLMGKTGFSAVDGGRWHLRLAQGWSARRGGPLAGQRWQV